MFRLLLVSLLVLYCLPAYTNVQIHLTSPADGARYTAPASVTVSSTARAFFDGERITSHRLYLDGAEIASGTSTTLSTTVTLAPGTYVFVSGASSNQDPTGAVSPLHTVTVVVPGGNPPTVTLGTPTGTPFIAPATVGLSAAAADSDGTITKVEFFANGGLIGTDTVAPYQISWSNVVAGSHSLTARATDNNGIATTSAPKTLAVAASAVKGYIDGVSLNPAGTYEVIGWACSTGRDGSIPVHVFAGGASGTGTFVGQFSANQASTSGVAAACQAHGTHYRFRIALTDAIRQQHANRKIYIHGIGEGPNLLLSRSGVFTFPAPMVSARRYIYRADQSLCKTIEPETGSTVMHYDAAGNLDWSADGLNLTSTTSCQDTDASIAARKVTRSYDARNRLKSVVFPDHRGDTTYAYTPDSLLASVTADNGGANQVATQYTYNLRRLMIRERLLWGNASLNWPVNYVYNANGHLSSQNWHGLTIDYAPNALGQPTKTGSYADNVSYYPNGAIKQFTYGNGIVHTMTQNTRQLPERSRDVYGSTVFLDDSYDYDKNGNVAGISDALPSHRGDRTMTYDGLDRLLSTTSPMFPGGATYRYDALDNLTRVIAPGRNHFYCYDAKWRLTNVKTGSCGGTTVIGMGYDAQGNLVNKNGQAFDFDYGNRLRSVSGHSTYVYDGLGRRIRDSSAGQGNKYSQYNRAGQLTLTSNGWHRIVADYIYLGGSLVAIRERNVDTNTYATRYQHTDALGSTAAVTNQSRQLIERSEYEPYGRLLNRAHDDRPGYTGHVMDAATGLVYMQQRYYDPGIGRFLSVDPVTANGNTGGNFNRYWYANNNPYRFTDPDGRLGLEPNLSVPANETDLEGTAKITLALVASRFLGTSPLRALVAPVLRQEVKNAAEPKADAPKGTAGGERAGKDFTRAGKTEVKVDNSTKNGGQTKCENCGQTTVPGQQSRPGVTPPKNETHVDHVIPKSKGGDGSPSNGQVLCRECNLKKSDKL